jgi:hypothetical protein
MAGFKERYKVQWVSTDRVPGDGRIRTYTAQSYQGAKRGFIVEVKPPKGARINVWPMGESDAKKTMRV